jgi:hypothetical protein
MSSIKYEESASILIIIQQFTFPPKLLPLFRTTVDKIFVLHVR